MDICILLYSHFHQVIRVELLQQNFFIILLERPFENFTFLRNFQIAGLKFIHKLVEVIKKCKVLHLGHGNYRHEELRTPCRAQREFL